MPQTQQQQQQELLQQQQQQQQEQQAREQLSRRLQKLQEASSEHTNVLEQFKKVEDSRRCYRMIGNILVERTVAEIRPVLLNSLEQIEKSITACKDEVKSLNTTPSPQQQINSSK
eukprot:Filipodium_phascolosomae@DN822_c0_g1_i1.p2